MSNAAFAPPGLIIRPKNQMLLARPGHKLTRTLSKSLSFRPVARSVFATRYGCDIRQIHRLFRAGIGCISRPYRTGKSTPAAPIVYGFVGWRNTVTASAVALSCVRNSAVSSSAANVRVAAFSAAACQCLSRAFRAAFLRRTAREELPGGPQPGILVVRCLELVGSVEPVVVPATPSAAPCPGTG